jgi:hypothetical protein
MRQVLTETVLLTILGGVAGLLLGSWGLSLLSGFGIAELPRGSEIRMDLTVVLFTMALALIVGLLVSLTPVLMLGRLNLSQAFREEGARSGRVAGGRGSPRLGRDCGRRGSRAARIANRSSDHAGESLSISPGC